MDDKERDIKRGGSVLFEVDVSLQGSRKIIQYVLVSITAIINLENVYDIFFYHIFNLILLKCKGAKFVCMI